MEALEAKLLYSADLGLSAFAAPHIDASSLTQAQSVSLASAQQTATQASTHSATELVFIDAAVPDLDTLLRDFSQQASQGRAIEVIVIRPDEDGLGRITQALHNQQGEISALHLIGHGESGDMQLGASRLDQHTLLTRAADIAGWQAALSQDADLLLYGCDVAAGTSGHQLITALAALTGADVAASDDRTGAAAQGGDWTLEAQTGHIDAALALSATAQAEWTGVLAALPSTKGTAFWTESGFTTPQQGSWDGITLGTQGNTGVTGSWTVITSASSPTRNETIVVGTDTSGNVKGEIWNGSTWAALPLNPLSTGASGTQQGFAVAYEQQSGDAMLLWNDGTTLRYSTFNGTAWSASQTISAYAGATPNTMRLAAQPHGDGMVLSVTDSSYDDYALIWDGSSWGHAITLDKSGWLTYDQDTAAVAYESQSGRAMVAYNKFSTSTNVYYRFFDGSTWSAETAATGYGETGLGHWLTLASDPGSNRIALGFSALLSSSTNNNVTTYTMQNSFAVWDGSAWGTRALQTSFADTTLSTKNLAVAFESQSGDALAVFGSTASTTRYLTWTRAGGAWSSAVVGPNTGQPGTIDLFTDPYTNHVMMGVQNQSGAISFTDWTGSAWGTPNTVASTSGSTQTQALSWIWANDVSGNKTNTLLVGSATSGTNWSGVNTVGTSELLEFTDPNLSYGSTTTGTFSHIVDFSALGASGLDDIAWVSQDVTLAAGLTLHRGDVLLTTTASSTLSNADGSTVSASNNDLFMFRPTVAGQYDKGTFTKLISGLGTGLLGLGLTGSPNIRGLALVEQNTTIGDVTLTAGTILFTAGTTTDAATIARFVPDGGLLGGLLSGNVSAFLAGSEIGIGQAITGLEVVSKATPLKNVTLNAGSLLITLEAADTAIATNNLSVAIADVVTVVPTRTSVNSTAIATATLLMRGSSVGASGKVLDTLALSMDAVPTVTSNGGGAVATVNLSEGATAVATVLAADADTDTHLTYSIIGGDDAALFQIDAATGALRFIAAPDYENPIDNGLDNHYIVAVQASDGTYLDSQVLTVVVGNVNEAPRITSNGGGQYASLSVVEGGTSATQVLALDPDGDTLSFTLGGTDAGLFNIDSSTGVVTFKNATDFLNPADSNADNLYEITVLASDAGALSDAQNIVIRVLQSGATANASPVIDSNGGGNTAAMAINEGLSAVTTVHATDADTTTLTYGISGGADQALFDINPLTGALSFRTAPSFAAPADADANGIYEVTVSVSDGTTLDTQDLSVTVLGFNLPPANTLPATFDTSEDTVLPLSGLSVTDPDAGGSATMVVTLAVQHGTLSVLTNVTNGVSAGQISYSADHRQVTLTASLDAINATLAAALGVSYLGDDSYNGSDTLTMVSDDQGQNGVAHSPAQTTDTDTAAINVAAVDDPPSIGIAGTALAYTENAAAALIDANLTLADSDSGNLTGAVIQITGNAVVAEDELAFINQLGITGLWDITNSKLTLSGTASVTDYQTALRSITYRNTSDNPSTAPRTVTFSISDASSTTNASRQINITALNDAPVLTTSHTTLAYTENDAATAIDPDLTLADPDNGTFTGATVQITGHYTPGEDTLSFTNQNGISGNWNASTGTLTLSGSASRADYEAALASVSYANSADTPSTATRTITFALSDTGSPPGSTSATRDIAVSAVNDAPVLTTTGSNLGYTENDAATAIDPGLTLVDLDDTSFDGATVQITSHYTAGEDALAFTNQNGITGSWDAGTGTLTLSGTASTADYQAALRSITYRNSSDNPDTTARTVSFAISDTTLPPVYVTATRGIALTAVNDAPVLTTTGGALSYTENDAATAIDTGLTLTDADNTSFTGATVQISAHYIMGEDVLAFTNQNGITGSWDASTGTLTLSGNASSADYQTALRAITYRNTSDNPSTTARTVTFALNDTGTPPGSASATRSIALTAVNDGPSLTTTGGTLNYTENDDRTAIDPGLTLIDPDNSSFTGATVQITGHYLIGEDELGFTNQNGITGNWNASTGTLTLSGTASLADYQAALRSVTYYNASDNPDTTARTITFALSDTGTPPGSASATRGIALTAVNDAPVLTTTGGTLAYTENDAATAIDTGLTLTDTDNTSFTGATVQISAHYIMGEDVLAFTNQNGITGSWDASTGTLTLSGNASSADYQTALRAITYRNTSDDPSTATRTISFALSDSGTPPGSASATRSIALTAVNDAPSLTGTGGTLNYTENDAATTIDTGLTLTDADNTSFTGATVQISAHYIMGEDVLAFTNQNGITGSWDASTGTLTLSGNATSADYQTALRSVTYRNTSDDPSTATRTISFALSDSGTPPGSASATRSIALTAVNDVPSLTSTGGTLNYTENDAAAAIDTGLTLTDADNTSFTGATVQITGHYANGEDILGFTNQNGITGSWDAGTGTLTLSGNATSADYQTALRSITYRNSSDNPDTTARTITFALSDTGTPPGSASATRSIALTAVNDAPSLTGTGGTLNYTENDAATAIDTGLTLTDADNTSFTGATIQITGHYTNGEDELGFTNQNGITGNWDASTGTLTLSGNATIADYQTALRSATYRNTSDNPGTATRTISFSLSDTGTPPGSASATRGIAINPADDAPVLTANTLSVRQGDSAQPRIEVQDIDTAPSALLLTATNISGGRFINHTSGQTITQFNYSDVLAGRIAFVQDGSYNTPSYALTVQDGYTASAPQAVQTQFTLLPPPPVLAPSNSISASDSSTSSDASSDDQASATNSDTATTAAPDSSPATAQAPAQEALLATAPTAAGLPPVAFFGPDLARPASFQFERPPVNVSISKASADITIRNNAITSDIAPVLLAQDGFQFNWSGQLPSGTSADALRRNLDALQDQLHEQSVERRHVVASSIAVTTGLSVGYVIWLVRGGALLGSMLSAMPAWQMIDPLPVLTRSRGGGPGDGDDGEEGSVEHLFDGDDADDGSAAYAPETYQEEHAAANDFVDPAVEARP